MAVLFLVLIVIGGGTKGPDGRGLEKDDEEEKMFTIITVPDLKSRSDSELRALFAQACKALNRTDRGSAERRRKLACVHAVQAEINRRGSLAWRKTARP